MDRQTDMTPLPAHEPAPRAASRTPVVQVRGLSTRFGETVIHRDLDLDVFAGQVMALVGGSGSGKTTLLREIIGLLTPERGTVRLFGEPIADADPVRRRALRRRFGMLFQQGALFSALSVFDNIAFPLRELHRLDEALIGELVRLKLAMVELEPRHGHLVLDEPTAGLDPDLAVSFVKLINALQKELNFTVVMVTHDLDTLAGLATHIAVLADQRIIACGPPAEVLAVDHPFIRNFFCSEHALAALSAPLTKK